MQVSEAWQAYIAERSASVIDGNPVISAYLQGLLLTGARRNELAALRWADVDFKWKSLTIRDKVEGERVFPLTPYLESLIAALPRRKLTPRQLGETADKAQKDVPNEYVFSSLTAIESHSVTRYN